MLLRRLARGGMAEVFLAQQRGLEGFDRRVAVKRILPHLADSPDFVKMFLGEARLAAQLTHPNVVHIYDFGKVDNDYFIAMEYVDGVHAGTLFKLTERVDPRSSARPERIPATFVARIGADAAAALHYAHELRGPSGKPLGLVHRDVSPANLMVSFDGGVKLCDFGIAKAAALSDQLTNPGQVKGKYAYMSPEQTVAAQLDGRSDVFSLAIVLWELLAGKTIVGRTDTVEAMRAIRDGKLEPLDRAAPDTPRPLVDAIHWALETRRDQRATAADLAQALEAFIKSSPELATPMQLASWMRPRVPREATGEYAPVTGAQPGTSAAPGTLAAPGTKGVTPVPRPGSAGGFIAASRLPAPQEDDAETIQMGSSADIRAAMAARSQANTPTQRPRVGPSVIVEPDPDDDDDDALHHGLGDTTFDPPGDRDRTLLRPRDDMDPDGLDDSEEDNLVDTFERRGKELREAMAKRAPSVTEVPQVVHAMFADRAGSRADRADRGDRGGPLRGDPTDVDALDRGDATEPTPRPPGPRRKLPEPSRPPTRGPRTEVGAPLVTSPAADRAVPIVVEAEAERSGPTTIIAGGVGSSMVPRLDTTPPGRKPPRSGTHAIRRRSRVAIAVAVLAALAAVSFLIALTRRGHHPGNDAPHDAGRAVIDAAAAPPPPGDATAAVAPGSGSADRVTALLEVSTTPPGATVQVGDQSRVAPTRFALAAGTYTITAALDGYDTETREVELLDDEHVVKEIALTRKPTGSAVAAAPAPPPPPAAHPTGFLSARTQPYSDIYEGDRLLGQTPLADLALAPGTYTLTFRNPVRAAVVRRVTITAGKTTKLQFDL
jgi:serine/threonine-protein kinase